jgi:hypothetical protein
MRERRKNFRVEWNSLAEIYDRDGHLDRLCVVRNFSNTGATIVNLEPDALPDEFTLRISPKGNARACSVIWRSKDALGVAFTIDAKASTKPVPRRRRKRVLVKS